MTDFATTTRIGQSTLDLLRIGLGTWPMSDKGRPSEKQAIKVIHTFIERGGQLIDTANSYCIDNTDFGYSEHLIRKALAALETHDVKIATKVGTVRPNGDWQYNGRPEHIQQQCEQSLKRLNIDAIFLYQLHAVDPSVPFEDSIGALKTLYDAGKVQQVGLSNVTQAQAEQALGIMPIASIQNRCNPMSQQDLKSGFVTWCKTKKITYLPYSPMGGKEAQVQLCSHPVLQTLAKTYDTNVQGIALAWLLHQGEHVLPLAGASKVVNIKNSLRAMDISLKPEDVQQIHAIEFSQYYL